MKAYVKQWRHKGAIIRQRGKSYQAEVYFVGNRERQSYKSKAEAEVWIDQKLNEIKNEGLLAFELTRAQKQDAGRALTSLKDATTLMEAVRFWLAHHKPVGQVLTMPELLTLYLTAKAKLNRRPQTLGELRNKLGHVARGFEGRHVHTITNADLENWLDQHTSSPLSRNKFRRLMHAFFKFARKRGVIELNPAADIETAAEDEKPVQIYSVTESARILHAASTQSPLLVPGLAIGFFAGLRPTEIQGLDWSAVDIPAGLIKVTPATAKKRRQRFVRMSDNLIAWLMPYRRAEGPVQPAYAVYRRLRDKFAKDANVKWIQDGLRHCYGSYHLAMYCDAPRTAAEMGHVGTGLLYQHYRELVRPDDAKQYWAIHPEPQRQVIQFAAAS